ncbi:MAG: dihydrodipicolinate synthase family protein [Clostridia bacterium]|nr:dihydrodipicolinate synthase family protein [Clostridia bacterium]
MGNSIADFKGVIPAVLSVFDKDENLDEQGTRAFIRHLMSFDIGGLYLTGSTGETFLMNSEERKRQVEIVMDEVGGRLPVVVHVGAMSTRASIELAKHAESVGAAGISSVPPFYFKFSEDQIFGYYRDIAEATSLPMIVYNIPLAGMMTVDMIRRLSEIKNVKGVKYTGTALYEVTQIKDSCKEGFQVYGGCDELGSSNVALGVDGIIGSFYNCIPDLYIKIWQTVKKGDVEAASTLQRKALHVIMTGVNSGSMIACIKLWLRAAGIPAGYARRPFTNFTPDEQTRLIQTLIDIDEKDGTGLSIVQKIKK